MNAYRAFGLRLHTDLVFPELQAWDGEEGEADVEVFAVAPDLEGFDDDSIPASAERLVLPIKTAGRFLVEKGSRVLYRRHEGVDDDLLRLFLLGSCLGAVLLQRGHVVLHGNAVSLDGETCRMIVGHSGAGKSTEAAWHYREGAGILADDVCAIEFTPEGIPRVIPAYPQVKLWSASAGLLGIPTAGLRRIYGRENKFAIQLGAQFVAGPLPLSEVIELDPLNRTVQSVTGISKIDLLFRHTYRPHFVDRMGLKSAYAKKLMRLAARITVGKGVRRDLGAASVPDETPDPDTEG